MSIPPRFLDEIRNRLTLSEIIGRRTTVQRAGREFKACCPFHKEKTPSFTINDDKQFYHCFGCGAHGDVIGFVMQHDNLSFIDAVEMLSAEAGLEMPKPDPEAIKKAERAKGLHELMDEATSWMEAQLEDPKNNNILEYVTSRGLTEDIRAQFRIGFAPADGQAMRKYLAGQGFSDAQMLEAGVLKKSTRGGEPYVFFRDRVMFPVADRRGRIVAFGGRILPEHLRPPQADPNFKPPKYINSSDTPLFDKGRMLYGESKARQAAREGHTLIVTEGYMDVIACHSAGFKGAVAPMGTALTEEQITSLWSMMVDETKQPVLCFDGDNAGRNAASRACERIMPLLQPNKTVRFAFLPDGEDPDSILRAAGAKGFKKVLEGSLSLFDFLWATHTAGRNFETPEARVGLSKTLQNLVNNINDADIQRHYRELIRTRISDTFFKQYTPKGKAGGRLPKGPSLRVQPVANRKNAMAQKILIASVLNNPLLFGDVEEQFGLFGISDPRLDALRHKMIEIFHEDVDVDFETLCTNLKTYGFSQEMDDILNESVYVHAAFARKAPEDDTENVDKRGQWMSVYESLSGQSAQEEVLSGWKSALEQSNETQEDRLRDLIKIKSSE
ncbi:MAG: DNA primase [Alphaproteobacteria bacterium]|nr:DNA primase [Alphaproteobacteria bacterium]